MIRVDKRDLFWSKVAINLTGCWEWQAGRTDSGYGVFFTGNPGGKTVLAHRAAFMLAYGPITGGLFACHKCDNPRCVRPDHMFLGTQADNVRDCARKGRRSPRVFTPEMREKGRLKRLERTTCKRGHPFDEVNTYFDPDGCRNCRECRRQALRASRARRKSEAA